MASKMKAKQAARGTPARVIGSATADRGFTAETADAVTSSAIPTSLQAGRFVRKTITLLPARLARVDQIAEELKAEIEARTGMPSSVPLLTLYRWLIDQGIAAYERGERPPLENRARIQ